MVTVSGTRDCVPMNRGRCASPTQNTAKSQIVLFIPIFPSNLSLSSSFGHQSPSLNSVFTKNSQNLPSRDFLSQYPPLQRHPPPTTQILTGAKLCISEPGKAILHMHALPLSCGVARDLQYLHVQVIYPYCSSARRYKYKYPEIDAERGSVRGSSVAVKPRSRLSNNLIPCTHPLPLRSHMDLVHIAKKLVVLKEMLHPPQKTNKTHEYTFLYITYTPFEMKVPLLLIRSPSNIHPADTG